MPPEDPHHHLEGRSATHRGAETGRWLQCGVNPEPTSAEVDGACHSHAQPQTPTQGPLQPAAPWPRHCWWAEEAVQRPTEDHTEEMPDQPLFLRGTCVPAALSGTLTPLRE